jgi:hypothetical protein
MRCWECVPGVIRDDGVDSFRLEVDANGVVGQVILSLAAGNLAFVSGTNSQNLRDDGLNGDRIAAIELGERDQSVRKSRRHLDIQRFFRSAFHPPFFPPLDSLNQPGA